MTYSCFDWQIQKVRFFSYNYYYLLPFLFYFFNFLIIIIFFNIGLVKSANDFLLYISYDYLFP